MVYTVFREGVMMADMMIYSLQNGQAERVSLESLDQTADKICYLSLPQLRENIRLLGLNEGLLSELSAQKTSFRSTVDVYEDLSAGYLNIINVDHLDGEMDRILFILRRDLLCLVSVEDGDGSEAALFETIMAQEKQGTSLARVLYRFMERLLKGGNSKLESIEDQLLDLENRMVHGRADDGLNKVIYEYRRTLSLIRNYYEQLVDISSALEENENGIYTEGQLSFFRVLTVRAERLISGVRALNESLTQLREMLDAQLNYALNNIMKVFTVITTVFLPLTLIVGWYGMNFRHMPELEWEYAYPLLAGFCVVLVAGVLYYFKKKKLM